MFVLGDVFSLVIDLTPKNPAIWRLFWAERISAWLPFFRDFGNCLQYQRLCCGYPEAAIAFTPYEVLVLDPQLYADGCHLHLLLPPEAGNPSVSNSRKVRLRKLSLAKLESRAVRQSIDFTQC